MRGCWCQTPHRRASSAEDPEEGTLCESCRSSQRLNHHSLVLRTLILGRSVVESWCTRGCLCNDSVVSSPCRQRRRLWLPLPTFLLFSCVSSATILSSSWLVGSESGFGCRLQSWRASARFIAPGADAGAVAGAAAVAAVVAVVAAVAVVAGVVADAAAATGDEGGPMRLGVKMTGRGRSSAE